MFALGWLEIEPVVLTFWRRRWHLFDLWTIDKTFWSLFYKHEQSIFSCLLLHNLLTDYQMVNMFSVFGLINGLHVLALFSHSPWCHSKICCVECYWSKSDLFFQKQRIIKYSSLSLLLYTNTHTHRSWDICGWNWTCCCCLWKQSVQPFICWQVSFCVLADMAMLVCHCLQIRVVVT